jgi:CBS domain-containing protein
MPYIRQILRMKTHSLLIARPNETVFSAIKRMADYDVGSLLVLDSKELVGILTERDYARNVVLKGKTSPHTLVREIMNTNYVCVSPHDSIDECMQIMTEFRVRHLPVIDDSQPVGVVSIGDLVNAVIEEQGNMIHQLESYISGELQTL